MFVLLFCFVFGIFMFTGCSYGQIPDKQDKVESVGIQQHGDYWTYYTNVKGYHFDGDVVIIDFDDGSTIITHIENVVIKLKGE